MRDIKHLWTCSIWNASQNLSFPSHPPVLAEHNFMWHYTSGSRSQPRADYGKPQFWHICDSCHPQHSLSANMFMLTSSQMRIIKRPFSGSRLQSSYITLLLTLRDNNQAPPLHPSTLKHKRWKTMVTKICLLMQIWNILEGEKECTWLQNCWHIDRIRNCIHC